MISKLNALCAVAASSALLLGAASVAQAADAPQTVYGPLDPLHPFAGVKTGDEYVAKFVSGKPNLVPGDPYGNMSGDQFWNQSWFGQNIGHPENTMASHKGKAICRLPICLRQRMTAQQANGPAGQVNHTSSCR